MDDFKIISVDLGGSHVAASLMILNGGNLDVVNFARKEINSLGTAIHITEAIGSCIRQAMDGETGVKSVGIACPGPFDYEKGVSAIAGVGGKFEGIFGLHLGQALKDSSGLYDASFVFSNDADCFAVGAHRRLRLKGKRTLFLTLGTGLGSAFMKEGKVLKRGSSIPPSGALYDQPFEKLMADDSFSTRWFLTTYKEITGNEIRSVEEMRQAEPELAARIFDQFGSRLGIFLLPWLRQFECSELVIGGNIARAAHLFDISLKRSLGEFTCNLKINYCTETEECILTGAALLAAGKGSGNGDESAPANLRKSRQALLPAVRPRKASGNHTVFPFFETNSPVYRGFETLADRIVGEHLVILDGYAGVLWEHFRKKLGKAILSKGKKVLWYDISCCLKSPEIIDILLEDYLNAGDPVFGKKYTGTLSDFFEQEKIDRINPDPDADLCIIYGTGASMVRHRGMLIYSELPKNEIQYRMKAGSVWNLGASGPSTSGKMYRRFYFVDWPVLNRRKEQLLPAIDLMIDVQRPQEITWMTGKDLRLTLDELLCHPFRPRPWFEPGVWGGQWMKERFRELSRDEINYAWSFEMIAPENGVVIGGEKALLELSFDLLLYHNKDKLLGKAARRFGTEFPIRFDFLDTFGGGNLSVQCHPRPEYIREQFGESFTQDETYYVLDCDAGAGIYLGFQDDIKADSFKAALQAAQDKSLPLPVEKYVQRHPSHKHDLFLIPNGTIHASGKNNLILEISSTPYIYTFKMYDWLRLDLDGKPRPISIDHAFKNLYFERKGSYVPENLLSRPRVEKEWEKGRKLKLPTHPDHSYTIDRYEFTGEMIIPTQGQCQIGMLVEGEAVELITKDRSTVFHFAETFVIPAAVESYLVRYRGTGRAFMLLAYIKEEYCKYSNS